VTLLFNQFPKVLIRNESNYELSVTFATTDGDPYPVLRAHPNSLRIMALLPGPFTVTFECPAGQIVRQYELKEGEEAELVFKAQDIIATKVTVSNKGNTAAYVGFNGPKWSRPIIVNPGSVERFDLQTGDYTITCSGSATGGALKTTTAALKPNSDYFYECSVTRTTRMVPRQ